MVTCGDVSGGFSLLTGISGYRYDNSGAFMACSSLQPGTFISKILPQSLECSCSGSLCSSIRGPGVTWGSRRTKAAPLPGMMHTTCRVCVSGLHGHPTPGSREREVGSEEAWGGGLNGRSNSKYLYSCNLNATNQLILVNDFLHLRVCTFISLLVLPLE